LPGATEPVVRWRSHTFTTDETATANRDAIDRQLSPPATAATTRIVSRGVV
jgi:hypothetical protein